MNVWPSAIAWHEGAHAAGALALGLSPTGARIDWPQRGLLGLVSFDWGDDGITEDQARLLLVAVLTGALSETPAADWAEWPPDADSLPATLGADVEAATVLAKYIGVSDRAGWGFHLYRAERLARQPRYRRLLVAIASALEQREVLDGDDLRQIREHEEETWNTSP